MSVHLDTNALLAVILDDRADDRGRVAAWTSQHGVLTVSECVLVETFWVLESVYQHPRVRVAHLLEVALESEELIAWDPVLASRALRLLQRDPRLGIVDCILAARSRDGEVICTFDRRLNRTIENL